MIKQEIIQIMKEDKSIKKYILANKICNRQNRMKRENESIYKKNRMSQSELLKEIYE